MNSEIQQTGNNQKNKRNKRIQRIVTVALSAIIIVIVCMGVYVFALLQSKTPVGVWTITNANAMKIHMTQEDAEILGLNEIGSVKLNKSGSCEIMILDKEYVGTWKSEDDIHVSIAYDNQLLEGTITEKGKMTMKDKNGVEYRMEKMLIWR